MFTITRVRTLQELVHCARGVFILLLTVPRGVRLAEKASLSENVVSLSENVVRSGLRCMYYVLCGFRGTVRARNEYYIHTIVPCGINVGSE